MEKQIRTRLKSLFLIIISNGMTMIAGVLSGFVIPKMMTLDSYGLYKIYTLYVNYLPLLHFGLSTGIYLKYGDMSYENLNKSYFRYYFRLLIVSQSIFSIFMIIIAFISNVSNYTFIIVSLSVTLLASNITNYFQLISQITERYKEYSYRNIIQSVLNIVITLFFYLMYWKIDYILDYKIYLLVLIFIQVILAIWYIVSYLDIVLGPIYDKPNRSEIISLYHKGFILIIAGLVSQLILNLDRQFVSVLFSNSQYALYAFAYNLLSLMTTFINSISTVLYPMIKRQNIQKLVDSYNLFSKIILIGCSLLISAYYILDFIINNYLPVYIESLSYLYLIIPTMIMSSLINIVMHNYYKALDKENVFFLLSIFVLAISVTANLIAYAFIGTMQSISIASVLCMLIWYVLAQVFLYSIFKFKYRKNAIYLLLILAIFYILGTLSFPFYILFIVYLLIWFIITTIIYKEEITILIKYIKNIKRSRGTLL